eukprot:CAMPEP_0197454286 /NCGR_PEP_ID=MMETSP1175-20131217/37489_1 /TAXON_ID=1003142 /ORGANISM="Triceratium dubium, Strain CCMP147" /LENGTH=176 /DNA_ID=CAMNT_0042987835 /DNA_START=51 /DNA_END=581 /DNA_ORIENTATION=+
MVLKWPYVAPLVTGCGTFWTASKFWGKIDTLELSRSLAMSTSDIGTSTLERATVEVAAKTIGRIRNITLFIPALCVAFGTGIGCLSAVKAQRRWKTIKDSSTVRRAIAFGLGGLGSFLGLIVGGNLTASAVASTSSRALASLLLDQLFFLFQDYKVIRLLLRVVSLFRGRLFSRKK